MKKLLFTLLLLFPMLTLQAQSISYIETTSAWYYIYDQNGKKIKTFSTNIGELQGYSASIFIVKNGSWYYIYDAKGNKIKTLSVSYVGTILSVSGDTFTSRYGSWIYTWNKDGKIIQRRAAAS
jgi:lipoprotein-anchoring transpeptidase ErfK/SrfK